MQLFKITQEFENVFNEVDENGEMSPEMLEHLDALQEDFENKAVNVATYIKNLEAEEAAIAQAMEDMKTRKTRLSKQAASLSDYLQHHMQRLSIKEIKTCPYFKIRIKQCPASVDVLSEDDIPAEFWREKVTTTIDKMRLKEVLSEGVEVPGACIQRRLKLEIK
jgi:hypothetical protein